MNAVSGISAKLVQTSSTGTPTYSIVITSDTTGAENGFQFSAASGSARWETSTIPASNSDGNTFSQLSSDATLKVDNVSVSRSSNTISDLIAGYFDFGIEIALNMALGCLTVFVLVFIYTNINDELVKTK